MGYGTLANDGDASRVLIFYSDDDGSYCVAVSLEETSLK